MNGCKKIIYAHSALHDFADGANRIINRPVRAPIILPLLLVPAMLRMLITPPRGGKVPEFRKGVTVQASAYMNQNLICVFH